MTAFFRVTLYVACPDDDTPSSDIDRALRVLAADYGCNIELEEVARQIPQPGTKAGRDQRASRATA